MSGPPPPTLPPPKLATHAPATTARKDINSQCNLPAAAGITGVKLRSVPKEEIRETQFKGSSDTYVHLKPTVQEPYQGPPQVVLVISTTAWLVYEWLSPNIKKV
jgi:hypothetical protein